MLTDNYHGPSLRACAQVLDIGDGTQLMTVQQYLQARRDAGL